MHLFLIFALTFTLSAQQNAVGEEGREQVNDYPEKRTQNSPGINTGGGFSRDDLTVPFQIQVPGGLKHKMTFIIRGFIPEKAASFAVDLMAGVDVPLHINPRPSKGTVVRNSFLQGSWGYEELDVPFNPFEKGKFFELSITCGKYQFIVYANEEFLFSYTYRYTDFPRINILEIKGDVILYHVNY